ncbi:MAG: tryptophan 2,3-dioxygenase, partial [Bacteroidetes bacterium]|nr:tryptophan 2,3-dioxygenase [Fibrella sp.]
LTYWDYIHLDTLLSLQNPRTAYPDELIFITYHQLTELHFKLIRHEIQQIARRGLADRSHDAPEPLTAAFFAARMSRVNRYFALLEQSFSIMIDGMEQAQFLAFRTALQSSSGFQSVQFRQIEIMSTDLRQLLTDVPADLPIETSIDDLYEYIYWKRGATEMATQQKSLTLKQFEAQYSDSLIRLASQFGDCNLRQCLHHVQRHETATDDLIRQLREYDHRVNVRWKLAHLRSAVRHLPKSPDAKATGGTNWPRYLPPTGQQRCFFPELWTDQERRDWGRMMEI